MKTIITIPGIFIMILFTTTRCTSDEFLSFFELKSVKSVTGNRDSVDIDELLKDVKKYEKEINRKIEAGDKIGDVYEALGAQFLFRQNFELAIESYLTAISYGNSSDEIHNQLAAAYANRGRLTNTASDFDEAVHHYKIAIEINSDYAYAHFGLGMANFYGRDEKEKGVASVRQAVELDMALYEARFALGRMLYELDQKSESLRTYQSIIDDLKSDTSDQSKSFQRDALENINRLTIELSGNVN
jgi:tetratricopeptide (TPR) repeat protein